jgi:hypothetical protein
MENQETSTQSQTQGQTIETTVGDLICAIRDAAEECIIGEEELGVLTQAVLFDMLDRRKA